MFRALCLAAGLVTALSGAPIEGELTGDWTCRGMKLGGVVPPTVYGPFRCRITRTSAGGLSWRSSPVRS